jgi:hypothetical protein
MNNFPNIRNTKNLPKTLIFAHSNVTKNTPEMKNFPKGAIIIFLAQCGKSAHTRQVEKHWNEILSNKNKLQAFINKHPGSVYTNSTPPPLNVNLHFVNYSGKTPTGVYNLPLTAPLLNNSIRNHSTRPNLKNQIVKLSNVVKNKRVYVVFACRSIPNFRTVSHGSSLLLGNKEFALRREPREKKSATSIAFDVKRLLQIPFIKSKNQLREPLETFLRLYSKNAKAIPFGSKFLSREDFLKFLKYVKSVVKN